MTLLSPATIKSLLAKYSAAPLKKFGQDFLLDKNVLEKIITAAEIDRGETVIEIGPGIGALTQALASRAKKVIAIEKDRKMVEILKETMRDCKNVEIIESDILQLQDIPPFNSLPAALCSLPKSSEQINQRKARCRDFKVVANLPYNIASAVIRKFLEAKNQPKEMILMLQKEVAQRICGQPPNMSLLSVAVQFYAKTKIISYVSKNSFWPRPKVDSAIIKITPRSKKQTKINNASNFFRVARAGFLSPRKQLINNLSNGLKTDRQIILTALAKAKISPSQRAETLSIENWINLIAALSKK